MGDHKLLDTTQIVNGIAVLLSFFVGYKYALKRQELKEQTDNNSKKTDEAKGAVGGGGSTNVSAKLFASFSHNYKMVLLVRNDLKMGKGKIAAQCGHGAVGAYQKAVHRTPSLVRAWENTGCAKVALKVESEAEMMALKRAAEAKGLNTCLIRDAGRTQIEPNSKTVLAIGPAAVEAIDQVTGHLKLL
ncbi:probable peptidyl-tRNA hydrolase 2 [Musca vetustissima]|uniref:probable peptidyl-tRNA hydrolase 2 n=1 Tax=Musca vetustissima TaxID=27455 RepID=UPI002AB61F78|nr:probable peptidyl-tRNA hydrolase 2 [Musca vetustissima]